MELMTYRMIPDGLIDERPAFPLSVGRDPEPLARSIAGCGLTAPLVLRPQGERCQLVCGFLRRQALRRLGHKDFPALIMPESTDDRTALMAALSDNLAGRGLNEGERVLAVGHLAAMLPAAELLSDGLPFIGLPPRREYLDRYLALGSLEPEALAALACDDLDPETGELLAAMNGPDRAALVALLRDLRPGRNKRKQLLSLVQEIGRREEISPEEVVNSGDLAAIRTEERLSRPQKEQLVRAALLRRRYPRLSELEARQTELLRALKLGDGLAIEPPPNFEGLDFTFRLVFRDRESLSERIEQLRSVLDRPELEELLELG